VPRNTRRAGELAWHVDILKKNDVGVKNFLDFPLDFFLRCIWGAGVTRKIKNGLIIPTDKDKEMFSLFLDGETFSDIGLKYGISRERVRQIIKSCFGVTAKDNSKRFNNILMRLYLKKKDQVEASRKHREMVISAWFGCHDDIVTEINDGERFSWSNNKRKNKAWDYISQMRLSNTRNIDWELTFPEWWDIWNKSGKYKHRGRKKGNYVMARYGDNGPYSKDNVYICKVEDNLRDIYKNKTPGELEQIKEKRMATRRA
jgi:hypothetical protein